MFLPAGTQNLQNMIKCSIPSAIPKDHYWNHGSYCGQGQKGPSDIEPVDEIDW